MKILLGTHYLNAPRGTETWTYTLATALQRRGHEVHISTYEQGYIAALLKQKGIPVFQAGQVITDYYGLCICNHNSMVRYLAGYKSKMGSLVCFVHGVAPALEQPVPGADVYMAVSLEVKEYVERLGFKIADVLFNFVDLQRFKPTTRIHDRVRSIYYLSNYHTVIELLQGVCNRRGIALIPSAQYREKVGMFVEAIMNHVDVVVTLGRGIYEAMAMGRAAFIGDRSLFIKEMWADGFATRTTFPESMKYNCNGKRYRVPFTAEFLESQIDALYCAQLGDDSRLLAEEYLDVDKAIDRLLCLPGGQPLKVTREKPI
jgi:hypothetical protein